MELAVPNSIEIQPLYSVIKIFGWMEPQALLW
jgi:hypothetical protein